MVSPKMEQKSNYNRELTSSDLLYHKYQAVGVTIKADADQFLHIPARLALVPQPTLATLVDSSASAQSFGDTLVTTPNDTKASTALVSHSGGV